MNHCVQLYRLFSHNSIIKVNFAFAHQLNENIRLLSVIFSQWHSLNKFCLCSLLNENIRFRLLTIFIFTILTTNTFGQKKIIQEKTFQYYGVRQGLLQSTALWGMQDSNGYLWISTSDGVSCFDGKEFKNFSFGKELESFGSTILNIYQYNSIIILLRHNSIILIHPDLHTEIIRFPDNWEINSGVEIPDLYFNNELYVFNCINNEINEERSTYKYLIFSPEKKVFRISEDRLPEALCSIAYGNDSWVLCKKEAYKLQEGKIAGKESFSKEYDRITKVNNSYPAVCYGYDELSGSVGNLYQLTYNGEKFSESFIEKISAYTLAAGYANGKNMLALSAIEPFHLIQDNRLVTTNTEPLLIRNFVTSQDNDIWLYAEGGIYNYHQLLFDSYNLGNEKNNNVVGFIQDKDGNMWFSTSGNDLYKVDKSGNIKNYNNFNGHKIKFFYMGSCIDEQGRLYFPNVSGVLVYDNGKFHQIETGTSFYSFYDEAEQVVYATGHDENTGQGLFVVINKDLSYQTYPFSPGFVVSICKDGNGKIRIGSYYGQAVYDKEKGIIPDTISSVSNTIAMTVDSYGSLWKGNQTGVYVEPKDGKPEKEIIDGVANFIHNYQDRYILIGFATSLGILSLNEYYTNNEIKIRQYSPHQGYDALESQQNGIFEDRDGYIWVAGGDKILRFHPDSLMNSPETHINSPSIACLHSMDKDGNKRLLDIHEKIEIDHKYNTLAIEWLQASLSHPEQLRFKYRLSGYSDQWIESIDTRKVLFGNLPAGKYHFEVQSSIDGINWSAVTHTPAIRIQPPFWLSGWFITLESLFIIGMFLLTLYFIKCRLEKQQEEERKMDKLRLRSVRSKHIPHFTGNVMSAISYMVLTDPNNVNEYINLFCDFSQQTLVFSAQASRQLQEEIYYTETYLILEKLRFGDKLDYSIHVNDIISQEIQVPALALYTFCENAMKHGLRHKKENGVINVSVERVNDYIILSVEDNGIGREKARAMQTEGNGEGLTILNQQLEIYNKKNRKKAFIKTVDLKNINEPTGTRFELYMPNDYQFIE